MRRSVNRDLYFIPLLSEAFAQPDRHAALIRAFEAAARLGAGSDYEAGYKQWERFLAAARPVARARVTETAEGVWIELDVPFPSGVEAVLTDLQPGRHTVALSTGLVLGRYEFVAEDLIWEHAFSAEAFKMAADTGEPAAYCARTYPLECGVGAIRTYPGFESGAIGIIIERSGTSFRQGARTS
jgi:hypothetical protein